MRKRGHRPNEYTFQTVAAACACADPEKADPSELFDAMREGGVPQDLCYKAAMDRVAGSIAAANESMKYDYKEGKRK